MTTSTNPAVQEFTALMKRLEAAACRADPAGISANLGAAVQLADFAWHGAIPGSVFAELSDESRKLAATGLLSGYADYYAHLTGVPEQVQSTKKHDPRSN